jgi:hypothetical protein
VQPVLDGDTDATVSQVGFIGDVTPRFEKAFNGDALFEMFAVVPAVELGFIGGVDVHRRQQHAFSGHRHFSTIL